MPAEAVDDVELPPDADPTRLMGVEVVNKSSAGIDVTTAGIEFDVGDAAGIYVPWTLDGPWCRQRFPFRLEGRATEQWLVDSATIAATVSKLARQTHRVPLRIRPFAALGDGGREVGEWRGALQLPIWQDGMTEAELEELARRGAPQ